MRNFDHHRFIFLPSVGGEGILYRWQVSMIYFLLYLCIFRLLSFCQKLNMTFQDFHNLKSGHIVTTELFKYGLFWKLSKNFGFHRNQCKMQILYGNATYTDTLFFKNQIHLFTGYTQFFHFMLFLLSKLPSMVCRNKGQTSCQEN